MTGAESRRRRLISCLARRHALNSRVKGLDSFSSIVAQNREVKCSSDAKPRYGNRMSAVMTSSCNASTTIAATTIQSTTSITMAAAIRFPAKEDRFPQGECNLSRPQSPHSLAAWQGGQPISRPGEKQIDSRPSYWKQPIGRREFWFLKRFIPCTWFENGAGSSGSAAGCQEDIKGHLSSLDEAVWFRKAGEPCQDWMPLRQCPVLMNGDRPMIETTLRKTVLDTIRLFRSSASSCHQPATRFPSTTVAASTPALASSISPESPGAFCPHVLRASMRSFTNRSSSSSPRDEFEQCQSISLTTK